MKLPLRLHYAGETRHEPAAWFLPGGDAAQWLPEIASWSSDHRHTRLRLIPHSLQDRRTCGVLVTLAGKFARPVGSAGIAYGCLVGRFFLPVDAELEPAVTSRELEELLASGRQYVFHPVAGLVAFDADELHLLTDLWEQPSRREVSWSAAQPGTTFNQRLISVMPLDVASAESIVATGGGDIGSQGEQGQLPGPQEDEPAAGPLGAAGRAMLGGIAGGLNWMARLVPAAWTPGFLQKSADWAAEKLKQIGVANEFLRNKEIERLMKLLADNPDEGLKYALPLADMNASRGIAPPGNRLTSRNLDFRLGGTSGPADAWQIDARRQAALHARYRELAAREINLGRYRRAAYIYAHLLNDIVAAAGALRSGQHWREAATLYRDKLRQPMEAASCLIAGGLLAEAIPILEELRKFEEVGELYQRLGEEELARAAFRQEVDRVKTGGDYLAAAALLDKRLHEHEEALEVLSQGWPHSTQAELCLQALWSRLDQAGRRDDLLPRMKAVRDQSVSTQLCLARVTTLASFATSSADRSIQAFAADAVRIIASRKLPGAEPHYVSHMMLALRSLAEGDKLLGRDTIRYHRSRKPAPLPVLPAPRKPIGRAKLLQRCVLWTDQPTQWLTAVGHSETIYAFGWREHELFVARATWDGRSDILRTKWKYNPPGNSLVAVTDDSVDLIYLNFVNFPRFHYEHRLVCSATFPEQLIVGYDSGNDRCYGIAAGSGFLAAVSPTENGYILRSTGHNAHTVYTTALPEMKSKCRLPIPMVERRDTFIGWGTELLKGDKVIADFERQITSLATTRAGSRSRLAVGFETGGVVYWENSADNRLTLPFGAGLSNFITAFTRGGHLVAMSEQGGEVYDTSDCRLRLTHTIEPPGSRVVAILPGVAVNQFAIVLADGCILLYEV